MRLQIAIGFLAWALGMPMSLTDPVYPPNTFTGGTVVAVVKVVSGSVAGLEILAGEEPFASSAQAALKTWRFDSETNSRIPVVIHFRSPNLFTVGSPLHNVPPSSRPAKERDLPYPARVLEPSYPPNTTGEGSVILRLKINESGAVTRVHEVKSLGGLTQSCADSVRNWRFTPARDGASRPIRSEAFAVCVFRTPLITQGSTR